MLGDNDVTMGYEGIQAVANLAQRARDPVTQALKRAKRAMKIRDIVKGWAGHPGGTRPPPKRKKEDGGTGASQQYHKSKYRFGRGISRLAAVKRLDKLQFNTIELQWRAVRPFNAATSELTMYNQRDPASNNPRYSRLPCYIFDITQRDHQNVPGILSQPVCHMLTADSTNNRVIWLARSGDNVFSGASNVQPYMTAVKAPEVIGEKDSPNLFKVQDLSVLRGCKLDFMLRGIRTRPTLYKIQIIQFKDEDFVPNANHATGSLGEKEYTRFWMDLMKPCLVNPLSYNSKDVHTSKKFRVIKSYYCKFNPDESSNLDTRPHMRRFTIDYKMNKLCDYRDLSSDVPTNMVDEYQVNDGVEMVDGNIDNGARAHIADSNKRIYVLVTAQVFDTVDGTWDDPRVAELSPSFDLAIHTWHTQRQLGSNAAS